MSKTTIGFMLGNCYIFFMAIVFNATFDAHIFFRVIAGVGAVSSVLALHCLCKREEGERARNVDKLLTWLGWDDDGWI